MAKIKTQYVCSNCAYSTVNKYGRCPECSKFGTMIEEVQQSSSSSSLTTTSNNRYSAMTKLTAKVEKLGQVETKDYARQSTGISEFDRALGGGLVNGSVSLLGGAPGIGKSTLLLQSIVKIAETEEVLYISGEESSEQIAMRGRRMGYTLEQLNRVNILGEIELEKILEKLDEINPKYVIIDSIQTLFSNLLTSAPGSVGQVKEVATRLARHAKSTNTDMLIICHITKDGELAGPRALEHIVDTVLYFEGDENNYYRMIRAQKNRFGAVNEIGMFCMTETGLEEVQDAGAMFLDTVSNKSGSAIYVTQEGNRSIMVEIQALLDPTNSPTPIKRAVGVDQNRMQMICAILNKYIGIKVYEHNVFLSLIGGMKFSDTGIDLPAVLAMVSSFQDTPLPKGLASFGEIGLTGELRSVQRAESRIKEADRLGFSKIIVPKLDPKVKKSLSKLSIKIIEAEDVDQACHKVFGAL